MSIPPLLVPTRVKIAEPATTTLHRVVTPLAVLLHHTVRVNWRGQENIGTGGMVVASNHISQFDFLTFSQFLLGAGRWPHFLAKESVFRLPVVGKIVAKCEQIPVKRGTSQAVDSLGAAVEAVRHGKLVAVYPEGTITKDPRQWPMVGHTGAVRIAVQTGCPLVPVAQWGPQLIMPGPNPTWPRLLPRKTINVVAGPAMDLSDYVGTNPSATVITDLTAELMRRITTMLGELRGEEPPAQPFILPPDYRRSRRGRR